MMNCSFLQQPNSLRSVIQISPNAAFCGNFDTRLQSVVVSGILFALGRVATNARAGTIAQYRHPMALRHPSGSLSSRHTEDPNIRRADAIIDPHPQAQVVQVGSK